MAIVHIYSEWPGLSLGRRVRRGDRGRRRHRAGGARLSRAWSRRARWPGPRARATAARDGHVPPGRRRRLLQLPARSDRHDQRGRTHELRGLGLVGGPRPAGPGPRLRRRSGRSIRRSRHGCARPTNGARRPSSGRWPSSRRPPGALHGVRQPAGLLKGGTDVSGLALLGLAEWYRGRAERADACDSPSGSARPWPSHGPATASSTPSACGRARRAPRRSGTPGAATTWRRSPWPAGSSSAATGSPPPRPRPTPGTAVC